MSVSVRSSAKASSDSANNITVNEPTGAAIDDWIIVVVAGNGSVTLADNNGSTAFTKDHQDQETSGNSTLAIFSRKKQSGDPSTYNFTSTATDRITAISIAFQDGDASTAYDIAPSASTHDKIASQVDTFDCKDITTLTDNAIHLAIGMMDIGTNTFTGRPAGYTEIEEVDATGQPLSIYFKVIATASATGVQTFTGSNVNRWQSESIAIKDGVGGQTIYHLPLIGVG